MAAAVSTPNDGRFVILHSLVDSKSGGHSSSPDGTDQRQLSKDNEVFNAQASRMADGCISVRRMACIACRLKGGAPTQVIKGSANMRDIIADGKVLLVFQSGQSATRDLTAIDAETGQVPWRSNARWRPRPIWPNRRARCISRAG